MAKQALAANRHRLWLFGKSYDFHIVTSSNMVLGPQDYSGTAANPVRGQKTQIMLHCTAGNGTAEATIGWWNNPASGVGGAQFVVERAAPAQAARPAAAAPAADMQDTDMVDALRVIDEDIQVSHGNSVNLCSIGIEIANVGWGWYATNLANESSLAGKHTPTSTCPSKLNIGSGNLVCNHGRPLDLNRWIHLQNPLGGYTDYQAFEDKQYKTLILLLRYLTIEHRIPRHFLGRTTEEVFRHWVHSPSATAEQQRRQRLNRLAIYHFQGILHHRNVHPDKPCPGVVHRDRLFRGVIDEWWLPYQPDATARTYYSGPFILPPFVNGQPTRQAYFRWGLSTDTNTPPVEATTYHDANLDAITETRSFFNLDNVLQYYSLCETRAGGLFPLGTNKIWHGGVHFFPHQPNPCVYAAASGTIVAARLSCNSTTENDAGFGSQRFILIRHYVYLETENDPNGVGTRINYTVDPIRVFSLYMHLGPIQDIANENNENPPWFNIWRRNNAADVGMTSDAEKGIVFNPDIEVSVGDVLGFAGNFRGSKTLHFEIFTHRNNELTIAPWDNNHLRVDDSNDTDAVCDETTIDRFIQDASGDGIDIIDILRAAPDLRNSKVLHKSEWSLTSADAFQSVVRDSQRRTEIWQHINRFTWLSEAIAANNDLRDQVGADGIIWHYHPVTFMDCVNRLIRTENRELREDEHLNTNVEIDGQFFLTNFVDNVGGVLQPCNVDNDRLVPYQLSSNAYRFHFTRRDVSCRQSGNHNPGTTPARSTKFNLTLLNVLEQIRVSYNSSMDVALSYVCNAHSANNALCVMNTAGAMQKHNNGLAVDFYPTSRTAANCRNLWDSVQSLISEFNIAAADESGRANVYNMPDGYNGISFHASPETAHQKLLLIPPTALSNAEALNFVIHMELTFTRSAVTATHTSQLPVRLRVVFESLQILDDLDAFSSGEWRMRININGTLLFNLNQSVRTGETINFSGSQFIKEVNLNPQNGESLNIGITGTEEDLILDDALGDVNVNFNRNSTTPWGIGVSRLLSSSGAYLITFRIESLNIEY